MYVSIHINFIINQYNITHFFSASGIVYCLSRNDCDDMAKKLSATGIKAASYHAGMTDKLRESVQKSWLTNKFNVVSKFFFIH